ncbi:YihY/virulence factor BrkB family protein [Streptomyces liangshanensis]|uniref:YihY/virulence factor BrkB family protein n=1 Tax=Streptomyces liangshanensis TaxID=2717324 RepID=A0A6G9GVB9_9ACTN|nr:YihY/virulence factor BrkB family protein [Streptomyces liangshanensis]QIQ02150.1 YihY/virulence factor BrkB family protein [Streptomyces liangshanensis]
MGTVVHVPQTRDMIGEELSGDEALTALRRYGGRKLLLDAFARFRYADGFSQARSLGFQVVLGMVPFTIALVGVTVNLHTESIGRIIELTLGRIVPGASADVVQDALDGTRRSAGADVPGAVAIWTGLGFAVLNLASAMGQIERGCNRIYGVERDRPFPAKYARGLLLALGAGVPMALGFLVLVAGEAVGDSVVEALGWSRRWLDWWGPLEVPAGVILAGVASAVIFRWSPRRDQPGYTWLAFGSAVHLVLWVGATWLLAFYVERSGSFGAVYGPLTAFVALLLWANLTGIALFLGVAFAAQLEAARAGIVDPVHPDPGSGP